jgi:hypothetical protein
MGHGRRRLLQTLATLGTAAVTGCVDSVIDRSDDTDADGAAPRNSSNATSPEPAEEADLATTATDLANSVFEDRAYERASERFTEQAQRLFRPTYFEQVQLGATAVGGGFRSVEGTAERSTSGLASVTLDLDFAQSRGQLVVAGEPDALTRAVLDGVYRSPATVDKATFESREITLEAPGCELPGTITIPKDDSPVPGAVIVPGDGIIDQDFTTGGTAMYRDLAELLASAGVATLRYDKRTFACDRRPSSTSLDEEVTDDALTAVQRLRSVDGVDPDRIVAIGHSLGGIAAPRVAERDEPLAGLIGLATPARPLQQLAVSQTEYLIEILEHSDQLEAQLPTLKAAAERVTAGEYDDDERVLGRTGSFWASLQSADHLATAAELSVPQLYLQGSRDFQVDPEADFTRLQERLDTATASFSQLPGLNHRFMPTKGPSLSTEYRMPNNVAPSVVEEIAEWMTDLG